MLERFTRGWHVNTLLEREALQQLASTFGFEHVDTLDLTPFLELDRPRDRAIAALMTTLGWLPLSAPGWAKLVGGHALQVCLKRGWVGYDLCVLRYRD